MRVIILEYAAKGNLLDFLKATERPVTPGESQKLWTQLLKLLDGLHVLHFLNESPSNRMKGVHQDIQPANILVFPRSGRSRFDVQFKLTDFGLAELSKDLSPEGHMAIKNGGSRMYSPPELYVNYTSQGHVKPQILPITDVWSLGAVYSEVLVWSLSGIDGLERYREARHSFIATRLNMSARGFDACFHNASERLPIIDKFLQDSLANKGVNDQVSPSMTEVILKFMLVPWADRLEAMDVKTRADIMVKGFTDVPGSFGAGRGLKLVVSENNLTQPAEGSAQVTHPEARIPDLSHPTASTSGTRPIEDSAGQPEPAAARVEFYHGLMTRDHEAQTSGDHVSVDMVYGRLGRKKSKSLSLIKRMIGGAHHDAILDLPGIRRAQRLINANGGRDQIVLIDNSLSMSRHMEEVARTARVISYLTKEADPNGMDFYLTSEPTKAHKCYSSSEVETKVHEAVSFRERCDMEDCLSKIMEPVYRGRMRQTSIYIYTDGNWEDNEGVASVIKKAIAQLVRAGELPSFFMFQFIQFGDDNEGTKRLQDLDDNYVQEHGYGK
ncbi:hypothetical protein NW762_001521 [Fusarium torreyae]|uniref:Protein kinase domain-containing protein n=1 Tax=Fusarium torreyae TaxID=1237075 RepID=A0A9W8SFT9_9HYPO|nr:hypothetical protein NW762_001521 [Fusarium torreyae]